MNIAVKDPMQLKFEAIEAKYLEVSKEYEEASLKLKIEQDRGSLVRKLDRWSKRGSRLRREVFLKKTILLLSSTLYNFILCIHSASSINIFSIKFYIL